MQGANFKTGVFYGTGAAVTVAEDKVGFKPSFVRLVNVTDGSVAEWTEDMPDAAAAKEKGGTHTYVTSGGITPTNTGFTLGTDADLNANGDQIFFLAIG